MNVDVVNGKRTASACGRRSDRNGDEERVGIATIDEF
uniref:Uncharacterized protein n=1 Tax=Caenorhabditis japonica TaxID=281687 RepID=A0A2Q4TDQ2_CAEJA